MATELKAGLYYIVDSNNEVKDGPFELLPAAVKKSATLVKQGVTCSIKLGSEISQSQIRTVTNEEFTTMSKRNSAKYLESIATTPAASPVTSAPTRKGPIAPPPKPIKKQRSKPATAPVPANDVPDFGGETELVSLSELCKELEYDPKAARRKLRKAGFKDANGTAGRWAFTRQQAQEVRELLSDDAPAGGPDHDISAPARTRSPKSKSKKAAPEKPTRKVKVSEAKSKSTYAARKAKMDRKPGALTQISMR